MSDEVLDLANELASAMNAGSRPSGDGLRAEVAELEARLAVVEQERDKHWDSLATLGRDLAHADSRAEAAERDADRQTALLEEWRQRAFRAEADVARCAADTTAAALAQEIEFVRAELGRPLRELADLASIAVCEPRLFHENHDAIQQRLGKSCGRARAALSAVVSPEQQEGP